MSAAQPLDRNGMEYDEVTQHAVRFIDRCRTLEQADYLLKNAAALDRIETVLRESAQKINSEADLAAWLAAVGSSSTSKEIRGHIDWLSSAGLLSQPISFADASAEG